MNRGPYEVITGPIIWKIYIGRDKCQKFPDSD